MRPHPHRRFSCVFLPSRWSGGGDSFGRLAVMEYRTPLKVLSAPGRGLRAMAGAALLVLAVFLGWQGWIYNLAEACWRDEWPRLSSCTPLAELPEAQHIQALRERLAHNPGDSRAWVGLAAFAQRPGGIAGLDSEAMQETAARLSPNDRRVLQMQAGRALKAQDWPGLLDILVRMSQFHANVDATRALGELIQASLQRPDLAQAFRQRLKADPAWLGPVVQAMPGGKLPVVAAMPLVSQAIEQGTLKPELGRFVIQQLKAEGQWLDAYAVWLKLWNKPLPLLFNGDFEQRLTPYGFDWEVADSNMHRAGAQVNLSGRGKRGQVLQVLFTGRQIRQPMVRQHLLLAPGRYRLEGEFLSSELRSPNGLSWVLSCATAGKEIGRSQAMRALGRDWQKLSMVFAVPTDCGPGVELALRTQAAFEADAGIRGEMLFDRFNLVRE